ncbi:hypothetical protein PsorP6_008289 [Peronosclerospora sorghi]|uniref:Uncharacterized protein n=1 Tax=Peronosclerospora sorghi TaxID=230839 RepID=A0ACC0WAP4_9STRA|nr:hypothetical protein PsorP6_008289 [Peronosclerospora sorghi]
MTTSYGESIEDISEDPICHFLLLLLIAIILCNHVSHKLHWHFLPDAAATIGIGLLVSVF